MRYFRYLLHDTTVTNDHYHTHEKIQISSQ